MTAPSPLLDRHQAAGADMLPYGPPESSVLVPASFEGVGAEYAAIRTGAALVDGAARGTLLITGPDRLAFLASMVTQDVKALGDWRSAHSFWLNRKGRIDADLRLTSVPSAGAGALKWFAGATIVADVDIHAAARAGASLSGYLIAEDAAVTDASARLHRLGLHGPRAGAVLAEVSTPLEGSAAPVADLVHSAATGAVIAGAGVLIERDDTAGEPGFELTMAGEDVSGVYDALRRAGATPVGWHAYNTARIEAGTPLYYLDFGPTNLPAESGLLAERVSFKKGCYLGQEIVARMNSLGAPKQTLVALRVARAEGALASDERAQPTTGAEVRAAADPASPVIGAVTSSTISPKLGSATIAFAMVKFANAKAETDLFVTTPGGVLPARVQPKLRFLP
jgi:folate-binding protein YgfZ